VKDLSTGEPAFMKVLNLQRALQSYQTHMSPTEALNRATEGHIFECELADACSEKRMTRVARAIDHGHHPIEIPGFGTIAHGYLVIEMGREGDIHKASKRSNAIGTAWEMRVLHQAAVGIRPPHHG